MECIPDKVVFCSQITSRRILFRRKDKTKPQLRVRLMGLGPRSPFLISQGADDAEVLGLDNDSDDNNLNFNGTEPIFDTHCERVKDVVDAWALQIRVKPEVIKQGKANKKVVGNGKAKGDGNGPIFRDLFCYVELEEEPCCLLRLAFTDDTQRKIDWPDTTPPVPSFGELNQQGSKKKNNHNGSNASASPVETCNPVLSPDDGSPPAHEGHGSPADRHNLAAFDVDFDVLIAEQRLNKEYQSRNVTNHDENSSDDSDGDDAPPDFSRYEGGDEFKAEDDEGEVVEGTKAGKHGNAVNTKSNKVEAAERAEKPKAGVENRESGGGKHGQEATDSEVSTLLHMNNPIKHGFNKMHGLSRDYDKLFKTKKAEAPRGANSEQEQRVLEEKKRKFSEEGLPFPVSAKTNAQHASASNPTRIDELMSANLLQKSEDGDAATQDPEGPLSPLKYNSQVDVKKLPPHLEALLNKHEPQVNSNFNNTNNYSSNSSFTVVTKSPHIRKRSTTGNNGSSKKSPRSGAGSPNRMQRIGSEDESYYRATNAPAGILKKRRDSSPELRRQNQRDDEDDGSLSPSPYDTAAEDERRARILAARRAALSGVNSQGPGQSIVGMSVSGIAPPVRRSRSPSPSPKHPAKHRQQMQEYVQRSLNYNMQRDGEIQLGANTSERDGGSDYVDGTHKASQGKSVINTGAAAAITAKGIKSTISAGLRRGRHSQEGNSSSDEEGISPPRHYGSHDDVYATYGETYDPAGKQEDAHQFSQAAEENRHREMIRKASKVASPQKRMAMQKDAVNELVGSKGAAAGAKKKWVTSTNNDVLEKLDIERERKKIDSENFGMLNNAGAAQQASTSNSGSANSSMNNTMRETGPGFAKGILERRGSRKNSLNSNASSVESGPSASSKNRLNKANDANDDSISQLIVDRYMSASPTKLEPKKQPMSPAKQRMFPRNPKYDNVPSKVKGLINNQEGQSPSQTVMLSPAQVAALSPGGFASVVPGDNPRSPSKPNRKHSLESKLDGLHIGKKPMKSNNVSSDNDVNTKNANNNFDGNSTQLDFMNKKLLNSPNRRAEAIAANAAARSLQASEAQLNSLNALNREGVHNSPRDARESSKDSKEANTGEIRESLLNKELERMQREQGFSPFRTGAKDVSPYLGRRKSGEKISGEYSDEADYLLNGMYGRGSPSKEDVFLGRNLKGGSDSAAGGRNSEGEREQVMIGIRMPAMPTENNGSGNAKEMHNRNANGIGSNSHLHHHGSPKRRRSSASSTATAMTAGVYYESSQNGHSPAFGASPGLGSPGFMINTLRNGIPDSSVTNTRDRKKSKNVRRDWAEDLRSSDRGGHKAGEEDTTNSGATPAHISSPLSVGNSLASLARSPAASSPTLRRDSNVSNATNYGSSATGSSPTWRQQLLRRGLGNRGGSNASPLVREGNVSGNAGRDYREERLAAAGETMRSNAKAGGGGDANTRRKNSVPDAGRSVFQKSAQQSILEQHGDYGDTLHAVASKTSLDAEPRNLLDDYATSDYADHHTANSANHNANHNAPPHNANPSPSKSSYRSRDPARAPEEFFAENRARAMAKRQAEKQKQELSHVAWEEAQRKLSEDSVDSELLTQAPGIEECRKAARKAGSRRNNASNGDAMQGSKQAGNSASNANKSDKPDPSSLMYLPGVGHCDLNGVVVYPEGSVAGEISKNFGARSQQENDNSIKLPKASPLKGRMNNNDAAEDRNNNMAGAKSAKVGRQNAGNGGKNLGGGAISRAKNGNGNGNAKVGAAAPRRGSKAAGVGKLVEKSRQVRESNWDEMAGI